MTSYARRMMAHIKRDRRDPAGLANTIRWNQKYALIAIVKVMRLSQITLEQSAEKVELAELQSLS